MINMIKKAKYINNWYLILVSGLIVSMCLFYEKTTSNIVFSDSIAKIAVLLGLLWFFLEIYSRRKITINKFALCLSSNQNDYEHLKSHMNDLYQNSKNELNDKKAIKFTLNEFYDNNNIFNLTLNFNVQYLSAFLISTFIMCLTYYFQKNLIGYIIFNTFFAFSIGFIISFFIFQIIDFYYFKFYFRVK